MFFLPLIQIQVFAHLSFLCHHRPSSQLICLLQQHHIQLFFLGQLRPLWKTRRCFFDNQGGIDVLSSRQSQLEDNPQFFSLRKSEGGFYQTLILNSLFGIVKSVYLHKHHHHQTED